MGINIYNDPTPPVITAVQTSAADRADLLLRSTTSDRKGRVLIDENTHTSSPNNGALAIPNGGLGVGGNIASSGYTMMIPMGYSVSNIVLLSAGNYSGQSVQLPNGQWLGAPTIVISPPDIQTGMQATAIVSNYLGSTITAAMISITNPGTGYIRPPTITFIGSGTAATAYALLGTVSAINNGALIQVGSVQSITVNTAGSGFTIIPQVFITPPDVQGGRQASAVAYISGGAISTITVIDPGSGYLKPPLVTLNYNNAAVALTAIITNPGNVPIVSTINTSNVTAYTIDFSMNGPSTIYLTSASNWTLNFDASKGFPQGRQINLFFKSTGATSLTLTSFTAANSSTSSATMTLTNGRTTKFEFNVLTNGNALTDVFVTQTG